jgi:uncharacterized protein YndB with AHSA1/START domain
MTDLPELKPGEGLEIVRVLDAPRERVWQEWTEAERFADWYGGADADAPLETVSLDVREGGEWKLTMFYGPDRRQIDWHGSYQEVAEPERLVFTVADRPGDEYELVTVVLEDLGDGRTEMKMRQTGGHLDAAEYGRAKKGWGGFLDRLEERLASD